MLSGGVLKQKSVRPASPTTYQLAQDHELVDHDWLQSYVCCQLLNQETDRIYATLIT